MSLYFFLFFFFFFFFFFLQKWGMGGADDNFDADKDGGQSVNFFKVLIEDYCAKLVFQPMVADYM